ncbi:MAG: prepilin-type N-terminal cleavage/methylation domain-containing protein [Methylotenera sp.]|nr:prepilin-type N-terminal cleavage/methylation domain-containing protein [Methylotenera sp.]MDO9233101.1 prepilin-type N-terminal cleavage/methylation domain-containing protein [Methylotenera sp.]MDO9389246.1 prepilin-type N-terminal cleavage/methylation domain-containing protein [Methylotenera sp.]MDP2102809.1 prepilin-type N-terminal cleavage/methylation domain-containing protein [Methylotenera sp.]MDP2282171.1 prepilin-type N-terminal cleavage/methylation domain-containing protein [Methylo
MKKTQTGFTLIELAIVLVIIGLLLGGVLKGQELINSAKVKNMATDFKNIQVYIYGYQDKFRALPGDDRLASTHVTGGTNATTGGALGNGVIEGAYNSVTVTDEAALFWQHVRLAGLAAGPTSTGDANYFPTNADGGRIGVSSVAGNTAIEVLPTVGGISGAFIICSEGVLGKFAKQLDTALDDGNTQTGSVRVVTAGAKTIGLTNVQTLDSNPYVVCMAF